MKNFILIICLLFGIPVIGEDYNTYELNPIKEYVANEEDLSVGRFYLADGAGGDPEGPSLTILDDDLVILDIVNRRILYLDDEFNIYRSSERKHYLGDEYLEDQEYLVKMNPTSIVFSDKNFNLLFYYRWNDFPLIDINPRDYYIYENYLFIFTKQAQWVCIEMDGEGGYRNVYNVEETIDLIVSDDRFLNIQIDSNHRLFIEGEFFSRDYETYYNYWKEQNGEIFSLGPSADIDFTGEQFLKSGATRPYFFGMDQVENVYWALGNTAIIVHNVDGHLLDIFVIGRFDASNSPPVVNSEGNLFFLKYIDNKVVMNKLNRRW